MYRKASMIALAIASICAMPTLAEAHPELKGTAPVANSSAKAPEEIRLKFSEGLIVKLSGADVKDQSGKPVETAQASTAPNDKKQLIIPLKSRLTAGRHTVDWHAVSEDTHRVKGSFSFTVEP